MGMFGQNIRESSVEWLFAKIAAVMEGRYPCATKSEEMKQKFRSKLLQEIWRRVPIGCILVWDDKRSKR